MRIWPQCIPCIINARTREIIRSELGREEKIEAELELIRLMLKEVHSQVSTIRIASEGFRLVKRIIKDPDPYKEYKEASNRLALKMLPKVRKRLRGLEGYERFRTLALICVNANLLDPGAPPFTYEVKNLGDTLFEGSFVLDQTKEIYEALMKARRIAFLLDNAGEAIFDKLLVKEISDMGIEVIVMAKSGAYQNDVTYEEAKALGFEEVATRLVGMGSDYAGPLPEALSPEAKRILDDADLIVAKGMANYEAFLYSPPRRPVAHLLKAKCIPIASSLGVRVRDNVAVLKHH